MGQKQSRDERRSSNPERNSPSRSTNIFKMSFCSDNGDNLNCFEFKKSPKRKMKKANWKRYLIQQLKSLEIETWPQLLVNHLESGDSNFEETYFQSELSQIDSSCVNQTLHYSGPKSMINPFNGNTFHSLPTDPNQPINVNGDTSEASFVKSGQIFEQESKENIKILIEESDTFYDGFFYFNDQSLIHKYFDAPYQEDNADENGEPYHIDRQKFINKSADQFKSLNYRRLTMSKSQVKSGGMMNSGLKQQNNYLVLVSPYSQMDNNPFLFSHQLTRQTRSFSDKDAKNLQMLKSQHFTKEKTKELSEELSRIIIPYETIIKVIETHFKQPTNIFYQLIEQFQNYFSDQYNEGFHDSKEGTFSLTQAKEFVLKATKDLQQFIKLICEATILFYKLDELKIHKKTGGKSLFTLENMMNFITSKVFNERVHNIIFNLYKKLSLAVEELYEKNLDRCKDGTPEDFGVAINFCLDEKTVQLLMESREANHQAKKNFYFQNIITEKNDEAQNNTSHNSQEIEKEEKEEEDKKSLLAQLEEIPYKQAIETLATLEKKKSPLSKLKTIMKVIDLISESLDKVYNKVEGVDIKKIDTDQITAIFMYLLTKSNLTDVTTHCRIIENFITIDILESDSGFYPKILESAVNCLSSMQSDEICYEENESMASKGSGMISSMPN